MEGSAFPHAFPIESQAKLLATCVFVLSLASCNRSKGASEADADGGAALASNYASMSPTERVQAALNGCYVGKNCEPAGLDALLAAAADEAEREALRSTARASFARQYQASLIDEGRKPESVTTTDGGRTLSVKGELCSRFLLENFAGGKAGKVARRIGFWRFECASRAMNAGVDLAQ